MDTFDYGGTVWVVKDFRSRGLLARNLIGRLLVRRESRGLVKLAGVHGAPEGAFRIDAFALAWEAVTLLSEVWRETPRYSDRYHLFRLVAHLSKYWTAEGAVQSAKWAMEAHGGAGILSDFPVERLFREAIILGIWEGTPHRQILDGMEVVERKKAHVPLLDGIAARGGNTVALAMARSEVADARAIVGLKGAVLDIASRIGNGEHHRPFPQHAAPAGLRTRRSPRSAARSSC